MVDQPLDLLIAIDKQIAAKHLLTHPFYLAWTRGELSKECLADYAAQYYHHVKAFPRYLSALHAHTENASTRKHLLQNLVDEEAGSPNHPEMWKTFTESLGPAEQPMRQPIREIIDTFMGICRDGSVAEGLAALYAYESQIPEICESKIDGLQKHYNMTTPADWVYFSVHIEADKEHRAVERQLLGECLDESNVDQVQASVQRVLEALWNFLSDLCERHHIACSA